VVKSCPKMKFLAIASITLATIIAGLVYADPSENGLEQRASEFAPTRGGENKEIHSVPDAGGTLTLLGIGIIGLAAWRVKPNWVRARMS
jgi:VPDSG-CTERM motif